MFDPARLVFLDETATSTNMVRLRGRCSRGQRLIDHVPHGHWKTITFVAGLRRRAMVAPLVLDGPMNATTFVTYLKQCLVPELKRGDVVIMDNLPVHRVAAVREVIEAAGAKLRYLPKYSPDLNPIEQAFSKLNAHLRKAAEPTVPRLSRRIGALVAGLNEELVWEALEAGSGLCVAHVEQVVARAAPAHQRWSRPEYPACGGERIVGAQRRQGQAHAASTCRLVCAHRPAVQGSRTA